ncbi:MAG: CoB--CoM heterodisulfide reductase iron-sulfur subunit A family protein [Desulfohalobiaceae bacterium]|nr:CoB--CoM heterodisulfide reductase iron-sulfur subunit A family protein [Desulfohalobiaceae bacterium]
MSSGNQHQEEVKVGVYICHCGGNISDHVDVHQVRERIQEIPGVTVSQTNSFMCSDPGQELIQKDIQEGKINRVVVASCAPSLHEQTFRGAIQRAGMNPYLYEHANIREQDSWVHDGDRATNKAVTLVAAAIGKAKELTRLEPIRVEAHTRAVVIGGGVAGLRAALDLSLRGIEVTLIERSPVLGGQTARLDKLAPTGERAGDLLQELAGRVLNDPKISIYTCADITGFSGYIGNFQLTIAQGPSWEDEDPEKFKQVQTALPGDYIELLGLYPQELPREQNVTTIEAGVIVLATGFDHYRPRPGEYGYFEHPEVITLPELIRSMAEEKDQGTEFVFQGRRVSRVAFIHCVGSRHIPGVHEPDEEGNLNEYCSRTCCSAALQAVNEIRQRHPGTDVFEYYRDIRTYGRGQEDLYEQASKNRVLFFRFEPETPPLVEKLEGSRHSMRIRVQDTLTFGEDLETDVDLVVLVTGMEPGKIDSLVNMMKLPLGADGFLQEVHPKLRPVEVANAGILLAGTCQAPFDVGEACNAAQAAAAKGVSLLGKGYVELDPYVAEIDEKTCSGTGNCVQVCPEEAIQLEGSTARVNPAMCTGCGMCVAVCPHQAININGWTLEQYEAMVDAIAEA